MARSRWERERGQWIQRRARTDFGRRRAQLLARKARIVERAEAGVGDSALHEDVLSRWPRRWCRHDESGEEAARYAGFAVAAFLTYAAVGPALLVGVVTYWAGWLLSPRIGPMRWWIYAVCAAAALGGGLLGHVLGLTGLLWLYISVQVGLGLLLAARHVYLCGWTVVHVGTAVENPEAKLGRQDYQQGFEHLAEKTYDEPVADLRRLGDDITDNDEGDIR